MSNYYSPTRPSGRASSASTLIMAAIGFMVGSALILPLQGQSVVGPLPIVLLATIVGAILGAVVGPLFSALFKADSALRSKPVPRHEHHSSVLVPKHTASRRVGQHSHTPDKVW